MGSKKFQATRQADGTWELTSQVSTALCLKVLDTRQKAAIKGDVTGVAITPVTAPGKGNGAGK